MALGRAIAPTAPAAWRPVEHEFRQPGRKCCRGLAKKLPASKRVQGLFTLRVQGLGMGCKMFKINKQLNSALTAQWTAPGRDSNTGEEAPHLPPPLPPPPDEEAHQPDPPCASAPSRKTRCTTSSASAKAGPRRTRMNELRTALRVQRRTGGTCSGRTRWGLYSCVSACTAVCLRWWWCAALTAGVCARAHSLRVAWKRLGFNQPLRL
jgi:hypothetical protein